MGGPNKGRTGVLLGCGRADRMSYGPGARGHSEASGVGTCQQVGAGDRELKSDGVRKPEQDKREQRGASVIWEKEQMISGPSQSPQLAGDSGSVCTCVHARTHTCDLGRELESVGPGAEGKAMA